MTHLDKKIKGNGKQPNIRQFMFKKINLEIIHVLQR